MDAHRDRAVQDLDAPAPGQIQRRPVANNAPNIDRHQPPLQHPGLDRRPLDRNRREHRRALRRQRQLDRQQRAQLPREPEREARLVLRLVLYTREEAARLKQLALFSLVATMWLLTVPGILFSSVCFYYQFVPRVQYSNGTDMVDLKTRLSEVNYLAAIYIFIYACSVVARALYRSAPYRTKPVAYMTKLAIYRHLSLGAYVAALFLALACGHVIYEQTSVVISVPEHVPSRPTPDLCWIAKMHMVLSCLPEWFTGWLLYLISTRKHSLQPTSPWPPTISGIVTLAVIVCVLKIY